MSASPSPVISLAPHVYGDVQALYQAYMPLFLEGGLFIPTTRELRLGDRVAIDIGLPDSPEPIPVTGTIAWITPAHAGAGRPRGVGIRFSRDSAQSGLRQRIEAQLGTLMASTLPTFTL
ncbi:PilZ domain-containing protein [Amphibiibacter pelophylacis]|uniref:PilZ domain-containing protein n=1 Tax=Amphibiibacter pelophylacis TaxID=1799477 RepID=A0ACC6P3U2_9BURK